MGEAGVCRQALLRTVLLVPLFVLAAGTLGHAQTGGRGAPPAPADPAAIERQLTEAVRRAPDSFEAQRLLAGFYLQQGRIDRALPHLERAAAIEPADYATGYDLALALLETGRVEPARAQVVTMLQARATGELHNLLGDIEERAGDLPRAAEAYQRAAHLDASEEHLFDWGDSLLQLGAMDGAAEVFTAALARYPASARLHVGLGVAHYSRGQYREAVESLTRAVDLAPDDPRPYQFLGELYGVAPELAGEITQRLSRFVAAHPDNALAHLHYALSIWKGQTEALTPADTARVEALLDKAIALDPGLTRAHLELGVLLSEQQRYEEAIPALTRAVRLDPALAQAYYRLAQAYQRTGQPELAARALETFQKLKDPR